MTNNLQKQFISSIGNHLDSVNLAEEQLSFQAAIHAGIRALLEHGAVSSIDHAKTLTRVAQQASMIDHFVELGEKLHAQYDQLRVEGVAK